MGCPSILLFHVVNRIQYLHLYVLIKGVYLFIPWLRYRTYGSVPPLFDLREGRRIKKYWGPIPFYFLHTNYRTDGTCGSRLYRSWRRGGRAHFYDNREHDLDLLDLLDDYLYYTLLQFFEFNGIKGYASRPIRIGLTLYSTARALPFCFVACG